MLALRLNSHYGRRMLRQPINSFQRKHRQQVRNRIIGNLLLVSAILGTGAFSYHFGEQQMAARVNQRMDEVSALTEERNTLHQQVVDLQAAALVNQQKITELDNRYRQEIPDDTIRTMLQTLREKLAAGVTTDRLATLIGAAENPRSCRNREAKRFMISTPLNQGTDSSATFASGSVTVSGEGKNSATPDGKPEAWYAPEQPVSMKFRLIGGRVSVAEGTLPLSHSIINDSVEHRFLIEAGPRGFVTITADTCDYPYTPSAPRSVSAPAAGTAQPTNTLPADE